MLSFDIAFVPFIIITLVLTLYFTLVMKLKPSTETKLSTYVEKPIKKKSLKKKGKVSKPAKPSEPAESPIERKTEERECSHYVGYLATLPKGTPFPEECFGCRKVIQCLRIAPTKAIESFYLTETETK